VMALLEVPLSLSTMFLPSILLAVGCAYAMHLVAAAAGVHSEAGQSCEAARLEAIVRVSRAVALSGLTSAFGFLAMATVGINAIRELATFGALGVVAVTAAVLAVGPALLLMNESRKPSGSESVAFREVATAVLRRRQVVIGGWLILVVVCIPGVFQLRVSTDIIQWFPAQSAVRSDYDRIRARLSGITPINVVVGATGESRVTEVDVATAIDSLSEYLREKPEVGKVLSYVDAVKRLRSAGFGESSSVPDTENEIEQLLLLLEGEERLASVLNDARTMANGVVRLDDNESEQISGLTHEVRRWWSEDGTAKADVYVTGVMHEFARAENEIAYGEVRGIGLAVAAIGVILLMVLRDVRLAILAGAVNVAPVVVALGAMGYSGIPLDAATACIGSVALGIAVDDTIHFALAYKSESGRGAGHAVAVVRAYERVWRPLVWTTATLFCGFLTLGLSGFSLIRNLGIVTAVLVVLCLCADLMLLPALLGRRRRT
ncbi:MAG: MMPL family transporter, partial [Proteobacteria bacterium]|nr:MMPL family transporter [Pseudomonadota bacterium]